METGLFEGRSSHQAEAQQAATSLQRNLRYALPELIHNVQNSRGSMSTTFKLYDDVSLVCEAVDSLINASEAAGKKNEAAPLLDDYAALARSAARFQPISSRPPRSGKITAKRLTPRFPRRPHSSKLSRSACNRRPSSLESQQQQASAASRFSAGPCTQVVDDQGVKKIIVDDTIPEKKTPPAAKKKPETVQQSLMDEVLAARALRSTAKSPFLTSQNPFELSFHRVSASPW